MEAFEPHTLVVEAVSEYWGERCPDFDPGCPTCAAWAALDGLIKLAASAESLAVTVRRIYAERLPDTWFVCGEGGEKDRNGLPAHIYVCPAYGVSWNEVYDRRPVLIEGDV